MEVERYKMTFTKEISKKLEDELNDIDIEQKIKDEMLSENIRILGHDFVKYNKNKYDIMQRYIKYKSYVRRL